MNFKNYMLSNPLKSAKHMNQHVSKCK